ncbi:MAG: hypothetical protein M1820_006689 [Bogoriella megaspora]|nr:MAG: hypothetical protein M1820_006689 [Bogoriella megaspora]
MGVSALVIKFASILGTSAASSTISQGPNACAALASQSVSQRASATPKFKPSDVYSCLQEVPINNTLAAKQVDWLNNFIQFQTTLEYLKNPPPTYQMPPTDLIAGFEGIKHKALSNGYANEYEFELAIAKLINSAQDGHLSFTPWLVGNFAFNRNVQLVSVSLDGIEVPKVYFFSDIQGSYLGNTTYTPSAISRIDGQDVTEHLLSIPPLTTYQDYDALFNSLFLSPVVTAPLTDRSPGDYSTGTFTVHADSTSYAFENGTTRVVFNTVAALSDLDFSSGQQLFDKYLIGSLTPNNSSTSTSPASWPPNSTTAAASGYPLPVPASVSPGNYVSGYFLQGDGLQDVAILVISSFDVTSESEGVGFQKAIRTFLSVCRSNNKKRLIIDVRSNPGGQIPETYDAFKQLFPNETPYSGTRIRAVDAANVMGQVLSNLPPATLQRAQQALLALGSNLISVPYFSPGYLKDPGGAPFSSWDDFYSPVEVYGDQFSHVGAWRLSPSFYTSPLTVSGSGNLSAQPPQIFTSENIVLGGEAGSFAFIQILAKFVITQTQNTSAADEIQKTLAPLLDYPPINPSTGLDAVMEVNLRDNIAKDDESQTPLQFTQSPKANCRIFYMPGDVVNATSTWNRIAKGIAASGKGLCVNGTITRSPGAYSAPNSNGPQPGNANAAPTLFDSSYVFGVLALLTTTTLFHFGF